MEVVYEEKPSAVKKYIYPIIEEYISSKGDLKASLSELIGKLYELAGEQMVNALSAKTRE